MSEKLFEEDAWDRLRAILSERVTWGRRVVLNVSPEGKVHSVETWRVDAREDEPLDKARPLRLAR